MRLPMHTWTQCLEAARADDAQFSNMQVRQQQKCLFTIFCFLAGLLRCDLSWCIALESSTAGRALLQLAAANSTRRRLLCSSLSLQRPSIHRSMRAMQIQQQLHNVLLSHISVCQSMGGCFLPQMVKVFQDMLGVYSKYSELVNTGVRQAGPLGAQHSAIKSMRAVKRDILKLVETFVETSEAAEHVQVRYRLPKHLCASCVLCLERLDVEERPASRSCMCVPSACQGAK